jgi:RNA-directed DNA polymerase
MVAQQLHFQWDRPSRSKGETRGEGGSACQVTAASDRTEPIKSAVMEEVVRRENLKKALKRACANKGSPGVDGMTVDELKDYLKVHWPEIRGHLLAIKDFELLALATRAPGL